MDAYRNSLDDKGVECRPYLEEFFFAERLLRQSQVAPRPVDISEVESALRQWDAGIPSDDPINSNFKGTSEPVSKAATQSALEFASGCSIKLPRTLGVGSAFLTWRWLGVL